MIFPSGARVDKRIYRIRWFVSPPFAVRGADGKTTGIAIDLVNQAASPGGIRNAQARIVTLSADPV